MFMLFLSIVLSCCILPGCWNNSEVASKPTSMPIEQPIASQATSVATHQGQHLEDLVKGGSPADTLRKIISSGNVVVDFFAEWCPPCKMMLPIVDQLAQEYGDKVRFIKVDIDQFATIAQGFKIGKQTIVIDSYPQFYFFKDGAIVEHITGARDKSKFNEIIRKAFKLS